MGFCNEAPVARNRPGVIGDRQPGADLVRNARPAAAAGGRRPAGRATARSGRPPWARRPASHDGRQAQRLGERERRGDVVDRRRTATPGPGQSASTQSSTPRRRSAASSSARQLGPVGHPRRVGGEPRIGGQRLGAQRLAQRRELAVVAGGHRQRPVGAPRSVSYGAMLGMGVAHPPGRHAGGHVGGGLVHHRGQHAGEQVHVHALALARCARGRAARPGSPPSRTGRRPRPPARPRPSSARRRSPVMLISPPTAWRMKS